MSNYPYEEIWRQQRDGARCGCSVCASEARISLSSSRDEPSKDEPRPGPAQPMRQTSDRKRHGAAHGCPVCQSGSRSHALVVADEDGLWRVRTLRD
jgi:hypothetical protein